MRDNFTLKTKGNLAKRVAWRCSFPGCRRITIGAGHKDNSDVINVGEAAHIHAASPQGPRYDKLMSKEQRISIDNGIWLCKTHARLIDADYYNYSAKTLIQWKNIAEKESAKSLENLGQENPNLPTTLIALGNSIVINAIWKSAIDGIWTFEIVDFIIGKFNDFLEFNDSKFEENKYIVIETQGDGRLIKGNLNWEQISDVCNISLKTYEKSLRITPYHLADISASLEFENGDFKILTGEDAAKQAIMIALSTNFGDMHSAPLFGSFFSHYYWKFKENTFILKQLIKLEITRLISIPYKDSLNGEFTPPLNFINRVLEIDIMSFEIINSKIPIKIKLEWGDGKLWESIIEIYIEEKDRFTYL